MVALAGIVFVVVSFLCGRFLFYRFFRNTGTGSRRAASSQDAH